MLTLTLWLAMVCALSVTLMTRFTGGGDQLAYTTHILTHHTIDLMDVERGVSLRLYQSERRIDGIDWSPDGERLYFSTRRPDSNYAQIAVLDVTSRTIRWLTNTDNDHVAPSVSPVGDQLVFQYYESGQTDWDIMLFDLQSQQITPLYRGISADTRPDWSSDGRFIAFETASVGRNSANVMVYDLQAQTTNRLTTGMSGLPAWTPDGGLLFASQVDRWFDIYEMNSEGEAHRRLTTSTRGSFGAVYAPAGDRIVYVAWVNTGGSRNAAQLFLMKPDGSDQTRLTNGTRDHNSPAWRPR